MFSEGIPGYLPPESNEGGPLNTQVVSRAAPDAVIATENLVKEFDDQRALDEISISVPAGVILGVIGPSGCGKTTLVRALTGIIAPTSGDVKVFGQNPVQFDTRHRNRFGYMPQLPVLFPNLTVWGNLTLTFCVSRGCCSPWSSGRS